MQAGEWRERAASTEASRALARTLNLPEPLARILCCRGLCEEAAARGYLTPTLDALHDPWQMLGMRVAVERIRAAVMASEPMLIYGDYDVDGTVATVLLKTVSERVAVSLGRTADVRYHIPHRIREGYGMQGSRIAEAAAEGVRLVISVDTGIRGFAAAEEARRVGLDLIVTDHHLPDEVGGVPYALAVLNPNQPGCPYPCKDLCGAGVAFKLGQALLESVAQTDDERRRLREKMLPSLLKLLAIATVADAVPLTGENRVIASIGLRELKQPNQPGLRALMELAGIEFGSATERPVSTTDVGFRLAPRINAAGRMDIASDVVEMFLSRDPVFARGLAEKLHRLNDDRRATEAEALRSIEAHLDTLLTRVGAWPGCLVLDDASVDGADEASRWHRGVIGILASRVVDRTGKPALVLAHEGDGMAYGSGRSVAGFHLLDAITSVHQRHEDGLFARFGGHAHAVGFSLASDRVERLRTWLEEYADLHGDDEATVAALECDASVRLGEITPTFLDGLERLAPFGIGNEEPVWLSCGLRLATPPRTIAERHLRMRVEDPETGAAMDGVAWSRRESWAERAAAEGWSQGDRLDVMDRLRRNWKPEFQGWELDVVAARKAG